MKKITIFFILLIIPFMSCKSLAKNEDLSIKEMSIGLEHGTIEQLGLDDTILTVQGTQTASISYALPMKTISLLKKASTYSYSSLQRPDGPLNELVLKSESDMIAWIGTGIREKGGVKNLSIFPSSNTDSIILKSTDQEWIIPADTETIINWGEGDYIAYASQISKGMLEDQPPFRCNLILLKK